MGLDVYLLKPVKHKAKFEIEMDSSFKLFRKYAVVKRETYFNIDSEIKRLGFKKDELQYNGAQYGPNPIFWYTNINTGEKIEIQNPKIIALNKKVIYVKEVGYQRKGQNGRFHEDDQWNGKAITNLHILKLHWRRYFSGSTWARNNFKRAIVDKFVEGQTFVVYW